MKLHVNRRRFLAASALAGAGFWATGSGRAADDKAANSRIRFACVGVGGMGQGNTQKASQHGDIVALCDVDARLLGITAAKYPKAKQFRDFRRMFDEMAHGIDAVVISTPDHTHAVIASGTIQLQKHCFVEKPLARTVFEARQLGTLTLGVKVATQMNNQGAANATFRRGVAILRAGVLGLVREVHVWSNRPIWKVGMARPANAAVPANLDWDLWLGPSPERPYAAGYHPFAWRAWWDFGTGAIGDMGCHLMNMPFLALNLRDPMTVEAESAPHNKDSFPEWTIIRYRFPVRESRPALAMTWYDGKKVPPAQLFQGEKVSSSGFLIIGDKGTLYSPSDYGSTYKLLGKVEEPKVDVAASPGQFEEFMQAVRGEATAMSNILDYAAPLTETVLLGNLAVYAGKKIEWDPVKLRATNAPELETLIRPTYRKGYAV